MSGISSTEVKCTGYRHFSTHISMKKNVRLRMTVKHSLWDDSPFAIYCRSRNVGQPIYAMSKSRYKYSEEWQICHSG